jgi:PAS domain S-box-containing protein
MSTDAADSSLPLDPFLALSEGIELLVFVWNPAGKMLWVNRYFELETGMSVEDFAFRNEHNPFIHPEDLPGVVQVLEEFLVSPARTSPSIDNRFYDARGTARWVRSVAHKITWQGEAALLFVASFLATDAALELEEQARHRRLVDVADDAIFELDADGQIVFSNRRAHEMLAESPVALAHVPLPQVFRERDREQARSALSAVRAGAASARFDGAASSTGICLDVKLARFSEPNRPLRILAIGRDVTEARLAASTLAANEERFRTLLSEREEASRILVGNARRLSLAIAATHDAIWEWNLQTGVTYYSPRWYEMLGYGVEQFPMTFDTWKELCHPDDFQATLQTVQATIDNPKNTGYVAEFRMRAKDGSWRWIQGRGNVVERDPSGKALLLSGTNTDLTDRKRAEEERDRLEASLRQAQKLESIGRLAGGVAHDFNNLLTAICGNIELARLELDERHPAVELLLEANEAAKSAAGLTAQLLAFSRQQVIAPSVFDPNANIARMRKMFARLLGEDIELVVELGDAPGKVRMDLGQFEQILLNLLVNARDAMPEGGRLTIGTARVRVDRSSLPAGAWLKPGDYVRLSVTDTGEGMPENVRARAFEPFFTTKEVGKGTGLGLAMVHGAVKQNDGHVELQSELGRGTTFHVYLPHVDQESEVMPEAPDMRELRGGESILLVEDEEQVRLIATRVLERQGYRVHAFGDPATVLAELENPSFMNEPRTLLITDVVMPGINGRALAEEVQALRPGIRVLFTSGYTEDVVVRHGVMARDIEFLPKPYTLDALARRVREVLDAPGARAKASAAPGSSLLSSR